MHADVQAYKWQSGLSPEEVIFRREKMTAAIEDAHRKMIKSGLMNEWYSKSDEIIKRLCKHVNGQLMSDLARKADIAQHEKINYFREGCIAHDHVATLIHAFVRRASP